MSGTPLHRFGGLGTFDGIDEFEDASPAPVADAVAGALDDALAEGPAPPADESAPAASPRRPRWSDSVPPADELLDGLNEPQRRAVVHRGGPLLVVAGAGSGKTRVLTHRVAHLIATGDARPWEILAITFTNKAADEMRTRLVGLVGPVAERMWVSTFHAACVRILRSHADRLGYRSSFTIYDDTDSRRLIEQILRDLNIDAKKIPPRSVQAVISGAKAELVEAQEFAAQAQSVFERRMADVYVEYQQRLFAASAMDFDDLLLQTVNLMRRAPDVLESYQKRFRQVLVDEYQDTNRVQNELVMLLCAEHRNVCIVGDTDQSIYAFRGADIRNILEFEKAFPDAVIVPLEQNYRSTKTILDAANAVIVNNTSRVPKDLWTDGEQGEPVNRFRAEDEYDEAAWVAAEIGRLHHGEGLRYGDVAIFYRTNAQSRALEEALVRTAVAYKVVGGTRFYDRREVKDLLAYLRVLANPSDEISARRIVNVPRRGVGDTSADRLAAWARERGRSFADCFDQVAEAGVTGRAAAGLAALSALLDELRTEADAGAGPAALIQAVASRTGYVAELEAQDTLDAAGRLENIAELVGAATEYDSLDEFLESVALVSDADEIEDDGSRVSLMTLHTAKGLEFPAVFLVGMEDGVFPHLRSLDDPMQLEEERRLAYVGITRARRRLYVTHAWSRTLWGSTSHAIPSRFLSEIPAELVRDVGASTTLRRDPTRLVSSRLRRRPRHPGQGDPGQGDPGHLIDGDDDWSVAADSAHDADSWHDPDPWDDDAGADVTPVPPVKASGSGWSRSADTDSRPRRPAPTGRKSRLPKMAEERFRSGA
ncbi:MAG TPA: UvrD-helicase domain-containing protein [Acidimicrobiales bacterium]|nr:UvrD-helicase domain-containing protein [Acidimicrobiales bacterium]